MKALAASSVTIEANASSFVRRSCSVWNSRSERPRAGARIGRDVFDAEMIERPADLGQAGPIDLAAGLRRVKIVAAPIRIMAQRQAVLAKHLRQGPERRSRAFLLDQKSRKYRARRVVQGHDQVERPLAEKPLVPGAVLMQHHARQRPALPLAPVRPAPLGPLQQAFRKPFE